MTDVPFPLLSLIPLTLVAGGLLLLPFASRLPRSLLSLFVFGVWSGAGFVLYRAFGESLRAGGWDFVADGGFVGARLIDDTLIAFRADTIALALVTSFHVGGGLLLLASGQAWGGGARRENTPASGGQLTGSLLGLGLLEAAALVERLDLSLAFAATAATVLISVLATSRARLDGLSGVTQLLVLHRFGDAAWLFGAAFVLAGYGSLELHDVARAVGELEPWTRLETGALSGYPLGWVDDGIAILLVLGAGARLGFVPFTGLLRHTDEGPLPLLVFAHGLGFAGSALVVLVRFAPLLYLSKTACFVLVGLAIFSAVMLLVTAAVSDNVVEVVLRIVYAFAALVAAAVGVADWPNVILGFVVFTLVLSPLAVSSGAAIEALQGRVSLRGMGGLWKPLKRSESAAVVTTFALAGIPGSSGFIFFAGLVYELSNPMLGHLALGLGGALVVMLLSVVCFRMLHLVFSGDAPRETAPANLVEVSALRYVPALLTALAAAGGAWLFAAPAAIVSFVNRAYFVPLERFIAPSLDAARLTFPRLALEGAPHPFSPLYGLVVVGALSLLGYGVSAYLFRKGPRYPAPAPKTPMARVLDLLREDLYLPVILDRFLITPFFQLCRALNGGLFPLLVEGPSKRAIPFGVGALQVVLRLVHNGDTQRGLLFILVVIALISAYWGAQ